MDQKQKLHEWMKQNGKDQAASSKPSQPAHSQVTKQPSASAKQEDEIKELKTQLRQMREEKADEEQRRENAQKAKKQREDDAAIHDMESGSSRHPERQDRFDKTYHLHYINPATGKKQPYNLHFIIRPATLADQNAITSEVTLLTHRLGKYYEVNNYDLIEAFAQLKVLGVKIPDAFKDPAKLHRIDILEMVYLDFLQWEHNFRQYSMD